MNFVVVDTETTGTDPEKDEIVEIGAVYVQNGEIVDTFEQKVNPSCTSIPAGASATHHLIKEDLEGCPSWPEVKRELRLHEAEHLVAHNAPFDATMCGLDDREWIDTLRLSKYLWRDLDGYSQQYLRYHLWLDTGAREGQAHRALADALVTTALALRIFNELDGDPYELQKQPIRQNICRFGNKHRGWYWRDVPTDYLRWMKKNIRDLDRDTEYTLNCELEER